MAEQEWFQPASMPELLDGEVHVWRIKLTQPADRVLELYSLLSPDERTRAERFLLERVRRQFIVGRGVLRRLLGRYLGCAPTSPRFVYGLHGKPELADDKQLHFNLSHSDEGALLGVTRGGELGVDLECIRPLEDFEQIARRFFAAGEVAMLAGVPEAAKQRAFFSCWTRKEAFIKAGGEGLSRPLDEFEVSLRPGEPARLLHIAGAPEEAARWTLQSLDPWPGYVGCIALTAQPWKLRCWTFAE